MSVGGLTCDAQGPGDFARLKGLVPVEEGVNLTFSISHELNVIFSPKNVKHFHGNVRLSLHPAPCTLHPAPCTLHPNWRSEAEPQSEHHPDDVLFREAPIRVLPRVLDAVPDPGDVEVEVAHQIEYVGESTLSPAVLCDFTEEQDVTVSGLFIGAGLCERFSIDD
jgi:hypothetical protein